MRFTHYKSHKFKVFVRIQEFDKMSDILDKNFRKFYVFYYLLDLLLHLRMEKPIFAGF
jgi:hypothetical protein